MFVSSKLKSLLILFLLHNNNNKKVSCCGWRELPVPLLLISLQPSPAPLRELAELWSDSPGQTGLYQTKQDRRRSSAALLLLISQPAPRLKPGRGDRHSLFGPKQVTDRRSPSFDVLFQWCTCRPIRAPRMRRRSRPDPEHNWRAACQGRELI